MERRVVLLLGLLVALVSVAAQAGSIWSRVFLVLAPNKALKIETVSIPPGKVGTRWSYMFSASGGKAPYTWNVVPLSTWLFFSGSTASGMPTLCTKNGARLTVQVKDRNGAVVQTAFPFNIEAAQPLTIVPPVATLYLKVGQPATIQFTAVGGCLGVYP